MVAAPSMASSITTPPVTLVAESLAILNPAGTFKVFPNSSSTVVSFSNTVPDVLAVANDTLVSWFDWLPPSAFPTCSSR